MNLRDRDPVRRLPPRRWRAGAARAGGRQPGQHHRLGGRPRGRACARPAPRRPAGDYELLVRDAEGDDLPGRRRVRQRGRRPPLRLHPRRLGALGGERPRQRPVPPGGARPGRRLRAARSTRDDEVDLLGPGAQRAHRRAAGRGLPARPGRAARLRRAPRRATGSALRDLHPGDPRITGEDAEETAWVVAFDDDRDPGRDLPLRPRDRRRRVPLPLAPLARPRDPRAHAPGARSPRATGWPLR